MILTNLTEKEFVFGSPVQVLLQAPGTVEVDDYLYLYDHTINFAVNDLVRKGWVSIDAYPGGSSTELAPGHRPPDLEWIYR